MPAPWDWIVPLAAAALGIASFINSLRRSQRTDLVEDYERRTKDREALITKVEALEKRINELEIRDRVYHEIILEAMARGVPLDSKLLSDLP